MKRKANRTEFRVYLDILLLIGAFTYFKIFQNLEVGPMVNITNGKKSTNPRKYKIEIQEEL